MELSASGRKTFYTLSMLRMRSMAIMVAFTYPAVPLVRFESSSEANQKTSWSFSDPAGLARMLQSYGYIMTTQRPGDQVDVTYL